jgi:hypothetical protein
MKFKVNDWVYHDYRLFQIIEINRESYHITDGVVSLNSNDFDTFPMNLKTKNLADHILFFDNEIRKAAGRIDLNWGSIHEHLTNLFKTGCLAIDAGNNDLVKQIYQNTRDFYGGIVDAIQEIRWIEINGVRIFNRM